MISQKNPPYRLILLEGVSILEQLRLEEALLRAGKENYCLINRGASPAIVMGISGKSHELLDEKRVAEQSISVIRRFSGGGTVYIDADTLFVTFICNKQALETAATPRALMQWSKRLYEGLFPSNFDLRENDYVLDSKKFGGNAQYIQKDRLLHHTSFLWDFDKMAMQCLKLPQRRPNYRQDRPHHEFLCTLKDHFLSQKTFLTSLVEHLGTQLHLTPTPLSELAPILNLPHRKATTELL